MSKAYDKDLKVHKEYPVKKVPGRLYFVNKLGFIGSCNMQRGGRPSDDDDDDED